MTRWRRVLLIVIGLAQMAIGALAFAVTDAIRIKAVESRTVEACFLVLDVLTERGALPADLSEEESRAHLVAIKPPIRERIEETLSTSYGLAVIIVVMALPVMLIAIWPSRWRKLPEHGA